jgi:RNA polymerase sigma-70 factor (ECF subfamily)
MKVTEEHGAEGPAHPGAESFEAFFLRTRDRVLRSALATSGGEYDIEDAVAEAYARALARWSEVSVHPAPEAWVMRTAVNLLRDRHRRGERAVRVFPRLVTGDALPVQGETVDPAVMAAIRKLPTRQREVLAMRVLMDLSAETTASALGISTQSVGTHLHRALVALRRTFDSAGSSPVTHNDQE